VAVVSGAVVPIVALDVSRAADALAVVTRLGPSCRFYKVGSELFTAEGPSVVRALRELGCDVFLDLKFHDIPTTVRHGVRSAARLGVRLVTVHASGGLAMLRAAREGAEEGAQGTGTGCGVLAVTVLTSLTGPEVAEAWGRGGLEPSREVVRLAGLAERAGVHGIVCGGGEAALVRERHPGLALLVPGIRLAGGDAQDQARVVTPGAAAAAGAAYVVLGRAVTAAADPLAAMRAVRGELGLE
jgi:orotidine-5'-phosphate decarboxylase